MLLTSKPSIMQSQRKNCTDIPTELTKYLSDETLTNIRSSPTRTFSPSDRCLEAGWMVHQHASPILLLSHSRERN